MSVAAVELSPVPPPPIIPPRRAHGLLSKSLLSTSAKSIYQRSRFASSSPTLRLLSDSSSSSSSPIKPSAALGKKIIIPIPPPSLPTRKLSSTCGVAQAHLLTTCYEEEDVYFSSTESSHRGGDASSESGPYVSDTDSGAASPKSITRRSLDDEDHAIGPAGTAKIPSTSSALSDRSDVDVDVDADSSSSVSDEESRIRRIKRLRRRHSSHTSLHSSDAPRRTPTLTEGTGSNSDSRQSSSQSPIPSLTSSRSNSSSDGEDSATVLGTPLSDTSFSFLSSQVATKRFSLDGRVNLRSEKPSIGDVATQINWLESAPEKKPIAWGSARRISAASAISSSSSVYLNPRTSSTGSNTSLIICKAEVSPPTATAASIGSKQYPDAFDLLLAMSTSGSEVSSSAYSSQTFGAPTSAARSYASPVASSRKPRPEAILFPRPSSAAASPVYLDSPRSYREPQSRRTDVDALFGSPVAPRRTEYRFDASSVTDPSATSKDSQGSSDSGAISRSSSSRTSSNPHELPRPETPRTPTLESTQEGRFPSSAKSFPSPSQAGFRTPRSAKSSDSLAKRATASAGFRNARVLTFEPSSASSPNTPRTVSLQYPGLNDQHSSAAVHQHARSVSLEPSSTLHTVQEAPSPVLGVVWRSPWGLAPRQHLQQQDEQPPHSGDHVISPLSLPSTPGSPLTMTAGPTRRTAPTPPSATPLAHAAPVGVISMGEGIAGGPQRDSRGKKIDLARWRKADPLLLSQENASTLDTTDSTTKLPVRKRFSQSVLNLFSSEPSQPPKTSASNSLEEEWPQADSNESPKSKKRLSAANFAKTLFRRKPTKQAESPITDSVRDAETELPSVPRRSSSRRKSTVPIGDAVAVNARQRIPYSPSMPALIEHRQIPSESPRERVMHWLTASQQDLLMNGSTPKAAQTVQFVEKPPSPHKRPSSRLFGRRSDTSANNSSNENVSDRPRSRHTRTSSSLARLSTLFGASKISLVDNSLNGRKTARQQEPVIAPVSSSIIFDDGVKRTSFVPLPEPNFGEAFAVSGPRDANTDVDHQTDRGVVQPAPPVTTDSLIADFEKPMFFPVPPPRAESALSRRKRLSICSTHSTEKAASQHSSRAGSLSQQSSAQESLFEPAEIGQVQAATVPVRQEPAVTIRLNANGGA